MVQRNLGANKRVLRADLSTLRAFAALARLVVLLQDDRLKYPGLALHDRVMALAAVVLVAVAAPAVTIAIAQAVTVAPAVASDHRCCRSWACMLVLD